MFRKEKGSIKLDSKIDELNKPLSAYSLSSSLDDNIRLFQSLFEHVDIMLSRRFQNHLNPDLEFCIFFSDGVVDSAMINEHVIKPLLWSSQMEPGKKLFSEVRDQFVMMNDVKESTDVKQIVESITYGDTLLLVQGSDRALILSSKNFTLRSPSEPESEKVLEGPREGFTEGIMVNLSMLRRRMRTNELKLRFHTVGTRSSTSVCICYMDTIVNKNILKELYRRLDNINIDAILDSNYITEHISESSVLGFCTTGITERPDVVASKLMEGRIAIIVDGTPMVITLPFLFIEYFQSNEDYYINHFYATFTRLLRLAGFFLTITIPAAYVAIVAFHHEILPASLMVSFTNERQSVPLSAALECFTMLIVFDILRETGVRTPSQIGQALSIVGALVIGQSAVEAKLVAAPMIIIVALTGITNLLTPRLASATLVIRYMCLAFCSCFGLTGLVVGLSIVLIHIFNLQSFGVPSLTPTERLSYQEVKDTFFRAAWPKMLTRIAPLSGNRTRSKPKHSGGKGSAPR